MLYFCNDYTEEAATKHIGRYAGRTVLSLFDYQLNFLCSPSFEEWWKSYYAEEFFDEKDFMDELQKSFVLVLDKIKKCKFILSHYFVFLFRLLAC